MGVKCFELPHPEPGPLPRNLKNLRGSGGKGLQGFRNRSCRLPIKLGLGVRDLGFRASSYLQLGIHGLGQAPGVKTFWSQASG